MSTLPTDSAAPRRAPSALIVLVWLVAMALTLAAGWLGWREFQASLSRARDAATQSAQQTTALGARIDAVRHDLRAQAQRLQQADNTNRVLRDELLGLGQRAALLEDTVAKLADPDADVAQALRLDELEIVLGIGQQRLRLAGDLDGARQAYAQASMLLDGVEGPAWLSLRQTLTQERSAVAALGDDPRAVTAGRLDAFVASLPMLPEPTRNVIAAEAPWWRRAFGRIVTVRPANSLIAVSPGDRASGLAALQLELTLAQAAVERRDRVGYRAALARADRWLPRLWPDSADLRKRRATLRELRELPLEIALPTMGATLTQLRAMRASN
ncbi:MAG: uroporphyrinogen-III C-methyltransferase [Luteimonas sp.]